MEAELSEIRDTFETNFVAVVHICQTFLPLLMKAKGTIVQIGSVAGVGVLRGKLEGKLLVLILVQVVPYVFGSVYNASKAAVHSFSDALRVELAPFGYVTSIAPSA
jgi:1-acylglycerone phosphate reductase